MTDFILHHGPLSPFSEKVRAMLGYAGLPWYSAPALEVPPRPLLALLAGGYRHMPVAQLGADIFCDSRLIAAEIATRASLPQLDIWGLDDAQQQMAHAADLEFFQAGMAHAYNLTLIRNVLKVRSFFQFMRFMVDRIIMALRSNTPYMGRREALQKIKQYMPTFEALLIEDFLFGEQPNAVDFSVYHTVWYFRTVSPPHWLQDYPRVCAWAERMAAFGQGTPTMITASEAIDIALTHDPRAITRAEQQDASIGQRVRVAPSDYGMTPTPGVLVASRQERWIIARHAEPIGTVHVHFPKQGYRLEVCR